MNELLCKLIQLYVLVLLVRIALSWFPIQRGTALDSVNNFVRSLTEPVLAPLRRALPPAGMFDLSPMVVFFGLLVLQGIVCTG